MAETSDNIKENSLIDPIYKKFVRGVNRAIGSTEFYEFFMDALSRAKNEFQFSNRKLIKTIDLAWVDSIEEALNAMQNIIASPRNMIKEEDLIVNVANVKRSGAETVRHLAQHSGLVESFDEDNGEVRPSKLMQRYREETIGLYENRLVFTTMEYAYHFVKIRHDALFEAMSDEFGAKLKVNSDMESATEHVHMDMFLHIKKIDSALETDKKNGETFARISRMYRILSVFMNSEFAQRMAKLNRVKGAVSKTNILKRNKDYKQVLKLFEFLREYDEVGYTIRVVEQNPEINEEFEQNIYKNIMFNYLILKGYLENEEDREIPMPAKGRRRSLKPKFIKQIVEELTEDYDLPDVEIRKVLIEELTKEQLMQEEEAERLRLVEEAEKRRLAEEERLAAEKKAEEARLAAEEEARLERERAEREAEEARIRLEKMERDLEIRRRGKQFRKELDYFQSHLEERREARRKAAEEKELLRREKEDYADAVKLLEEAEQMKKDELARERQRKKEERERAEAERIRAREEASAAKAAEEERLRLERETEEKRLAAEQRACDLIVLQPYIAELAYFKERANEQKRLRKEYGQRQRLANEAHERAKMLRAQKKEVNKY